MEIIWVAFAAAIMLPGLLGVIFPIFPGLPYIWLVILGYAALHDFQTITTSEFFWLSLLPLAGVCIDYLAGTLAIRLAGGSIRSLGWGTFGLITGTLLLPPVGGFVGLMLAVFVSELYQHRNNGHALRVATAGVIGQTTGMAINLMVGLTMIILFVLWAL